MEGWKLDDSLSHCLDRGCLLRRGRTTAALKADGKEPVSSRNTKGGEAQTGLHKNCLGGTEKLSVALSTRERTTANRRSMF